MEIGATNRAGRHAHEQLIRSRRGPRHLFADERPAGRFENHRAHKDGYTHFGAFENTAQFSASEWQATVIDGRRVALPCRAS
jgi:hypothetical protein